MIRDVGALVVGSNQSAVQAALDLADSGIPVLLVERSPFLDGGYTPQLPIPQMLRLILHANITLLTDARVTSCYESGRSIGIWHGPRYVDLEKCVACGDCAAICPMPLQDLVGMSAADHAAIHKPLPYAVPNIYAIEKVGTAPCRNACPIDQRAQGYIALIREGRFAEAYLTIKQENPFPSICGRVCNHRCEEACNRGKLDAPLNVMGLKRFVADWAAEHPEEIAAAIRQVGSGPGSHGEYLPEKRVAVVGGGPAGLTCALDLVRLGYQVTVFEAQPVAGGMMRLGVPDYRLPPDVVQREIDEIVAAGVELKLDSRIDDMGALLEQGYDAIFIAVGAHIGAQLPILGADLPDVYLATDFLRAVNLGESIDVAGRRVLVIGGGNVGLDVAQISVRSGAARVGMACLERRDQMPAFEWEIRDAEEEGVEIFPQRTFKEVTGSSYVDGEWVTGVRCVQVDFRGFVEGRPDMEEIPGTEEIMPADVVVFAVGQWPDLTGIPEGIERYRGRWLVADKETQVTNLPGVTAGGDVVTGTRFIVDAIAAGHKAAYALDTYLRTGSAEGWQATNPSQAVVDLTAEEVAARLRGSDARYAADLPRTELRKLPAAKRTQGFMEVQWGYTPEQAIAEARRCLVCGACSECLACVRVCQADAIDHLQQPEQLAVEADVVIWADGEPPPISDTAAGRVFQLPANDPPRASAIVAQAMAELAFRRVTRTPPVTRIPPGSDEARIGIFVCRCGDKIDSVLDVDDLVDGAKSLTDVVFAQALPFSCQPDATITMRQAVRRHRLNRIVLAACACCTLDQACDSCTYQRVRCKRSLLGLPLDWLAAPPPSGDESASGIIIEFVNIREQCAWAHRHEPALATAKARRLIAAAAVKAGMISAMSRPVIEIAGRVLVAGEGEAATVCANALRLQSLAVAHCEQIPTAVAGSYGQFAVTLQSDRWQWQVDTSVVVLVPAEPAQVAHLQPRPGLYVCPADEDWRTSGMAMAAKVGALLGSGRVLPDRNVARVDPSRCLGCGTCEEVCEYLAVRTAEIKNLPATDPMRGLMDVIGGGQREDQVRMRAEVNEALCQGCGVCAAHCPSSAIQAGYLTDEEIEAMLGALLVAQE